MGDIEKNFEEAKNLIIKAYDKLKSAKILKENNQKEDVVSLCYYSAFHAVRAILILMGERPKTHSGTHTLFGMKLFKEGILPSKYGKTFAQLFQARQSDDYELFTYYENEDLANFIQNTEDLIRDIEVKINELEKKQNV